MGVSGGPDSLALSYLLKCFSLKNKHNIFYYIVDHKLRHESTNETKFIKNKLKNYDINVKILSWIGKKPKSNIQSIARKKRYNLILKECLKNNVENFLTAHHQDDLYENFFLRILRGSGLKGFVSFNSTRNFFPSYNCQIIRPLLNTNKKELIYISKIVYGFYITDPSNLSDDFKRIRIRKLIDKFKNEGLDFGKLKLTINNLSDSNRTINFYVNKNISDNSKVVKNSSCILSKNFFNQPDEIVFRSFSKILKEIGKKYYAPRGKSTLRAIHQIQQKNIKKITLSGCVIQKLSNSVIISSEFAK